MESRFHINLRLLRKSKKLTLEVLGGHIGVSKSALSDYENGRSFPSLDVCEKISDFFGINIDSLRNSENLEFPKREENKITEQHTDFNSEINKLEFQNKLLHQQVEGLQIQLQLIRQLVSSKDSEIKSLQIQIKLLEEKMEELLHH